MGQGAVFFRPDGGPGAARAGICGGEGGPSA